MAVRRRVVEQHEDWLNLTDAETPWFSLPVLKRAFPNGLDKPKPELRAEHKARWYGDGVSGSARLTDDRSDYIDWLLQDVLGWGDDYLSNTDLPSGFAQGVTRHEITVKPTGVYQPTTRVAVDLLTEPTSTHGTADYGTGGDQTNSPRVLIFSLPVGTDPRTRPPDDTWPATWVQRAALSCRHYRVPLALVTDGDHLTLVHAPEQGATGWGTWRASEFATESVLLDSFRSMLRSWRFTGASQENTPETLLKESASSQAEVTDQLGMQVRQAVELLVNAISRANRDRDGTLLDGVTPNEVYEAAVTVMMRVVFLLIAEENDLLPIDNRHYQDLYSVRTLRETLEKERYQNPEALETRTTAWHRLLATSRALHSGVHHHDLSVPAYGGSLFDPDRFPFLEGRAAGSTWHTTTSTPIAVTDLDVLAILDSLLVLRFRDSRGTTDTRRLSYRNVDVEQIGHIYERLLDHDAVTAEHVVVGLRGRKPGEEPKIALPELEAKRMDGTKALVAWLSNKEAAKAGRRVGTKNQVGKLLAEPLDRHRRATLIQACQGDQTMAARIEPFANLLRLDLRDRPLVFLKDTVYVTETTSRRDSGTAYTTRELAEEVVKHTLAPLCYSPGPQDTPDTNQWRIRKPDDILALKVCDPTVGSGAILVAACRYLADRLIEARQAEDNQRTQETATAADDPNRLDIVVEARRLIAERCCYGVDINPMAAEMAKLSMWITTVAKDRPFTFLDHAIKSGDSLLGISNLDQLCYLHYDVTAGRARPTPIPGFTAGGVAVESVERLVREALEMRRELHSIETIRPADIERKQVLHQRSENRLSILATIADILIGIALNTAGGTDYEKALTNLPDVDAQIIVQLIEALDTPSQAAALDRAKQRGYKRLNTECPDGAPSRRPLHWPIAFPEVFSSTSTPGFDAIVGNPPFMGGQKITGAIGTDYRNHLITWIANRKRGSADLVAYFFLNATKVAKSFGFLATNTIAQGDTSEVGLTQIIDTGWTIHRAVSSTTWPGDTSLEIAKVWGTAYPWRGERMLDGRSVVGIDEMLYPVSRSGWRKQCLNANANKSFIGSYLLGTDGFTMSPEKAQALINKDPRNADVLFPYLGGQNLNQSPTLTAPRWVINFFDWPENKARQYPECFAIVEEKVKPVRQERKLNGEFKKRKPLPQLYWVYAEKRPKLYRTIKPLKRVLVISRVGDTLKPVFVKNDQVFADSTVVFAYDDNFHFGILTSGFHYRWAVRYASSLETRTRYTPSDVFETFPQPSYHATVENVGKVLDNHRAQLMRDRKLGLTDVYNLVHNQDVRSDSTIRKLRDLHVELDLAVRDAYKWYDLDLEHDFHHVRGQGIRFTFSPQAADEVLDRLLELNKKRHAAELDAELHKPVKKKYSRIRKDITIHKIYQKSLLE
ncbi:MAG: hypothetical protein OXI96_07995 [Acidimicrobiaceae bacterium]|nr:hypothetical protein [Acidimicrobiaceae bacterium]